MTKTPLDAIDKALRRLPGATVFADMPAALRWVEESVDVLLLHKMTSMALTFEEREVYDPMEAIMVYAKDFGLRQRKHRLPWVDALLEVVAEMCFCDIMPLGGTLTTWVIGRRGDRTVAVTLLGTLVPTIEKLVETEYYVEYQAARRAGKVEAAQGFKKQWREEQVEKIAEVARKKYAELVKAHGKEVSKVFKHAQHETAAFVQEHVLPTRGNKNARFRPPQG